MKKIVLLRHGERMEQRNRFTGWTDVDLTEKGLKKHIKQVNY